MASSSSAPPGARKRRRIDDVVDPLIDYKQRQQQLVSDPTDFRWNPSLIEAEVGTTLKLVDGIDVTADRRRWEPSLLELSLAQVNWYASDNDCGCAHGYVMKGVADRASVDALANTLAQVCLICTILLYYGVVGCRSHRLGTQIREMLNPSESVGGRVPLRLTMLR